MSIKVGDKVRLIDKFYEHEAFKKLVRYHRKDIANQSGKELKILEINCGKVRYSAKDDGWYAIPVELLKKVEELPKKTVFDKAEDLIEACAELIKPVVEMARDIIEKLVEIYGVDLVEIGKRIEQGMSFQEAIESMSKHRYTPEQVAEAQRIIGEIVAGFKSGQRYYIRDESGKELIIRYTEEVRDGMHTITAHCSPHDEFNRTIGLLVALCKATGRKLPDWI